MRKLILLFAVSGSLLASNYRLVPMSSHGIALSSSNLAKSFNADAVFINPANMAFLDNAQMHFSLNYYNIIGSKFKNTFNGAEYGYYNASDDYGKNFLVILPTFAYTTPLTENSYVGVAAYTDFAALYGWNGDYAKSLADKMDVRGGTVALSYAYKFNPELSFGASITANYTKLRFGLHKDNAKSLNYYKAQNATHNKPTWVDSNGNIRDSYWAYSGKADTHNDIEYGYKLALTYAPEKFDEKLRFSAVYNSKYMSEFYGTLDFSISKFELTDFYFRAGLGTNTMAYAFDYMLKNYGLDVASKHPFFQSYFGINTIISAILLDVFEFDPIDGSPLNTFASQDDPMRFHGALQTAFLYPESINFGIAYEYGKHEFMVNVGRTFWHKFKRLSVDINAPTIPIKTMQLIGATAKTCEAIGCENSGKLQEAIKAAMQTIGFSDKDKQEMETFMIGTLLNDSIAQKWKDTTLISLGYRYNYDDKWSFMAGFATEDSPVRREEITFLAKDSRMYMYSLGVEYRHSKNLIFNLSAMHQKYKDAEVDTTNHSSAIFMITKGKFKKQSNQIINFGFSYIF